MASGEAFLYRFAKRWIAGPNQESLILDAKRSNASGMNVIANYLREDIKELAAADSWVQEYQFLQNTLSWLAYSKRRLTEHSSNFWLLLRALV